MAPMTLSSAKPTGPMSREFVTGPTFLIDPTSEGPIRAERLGIERLESHARQLATACSTEPRRRVQSPLLGRFIDNSRVLRRVHDELVAWHSERRDLPGIDAEWLVDNFHIISDSLREVTRDLPPGYDELLPKLGTAPLVGYPRVFAVALALVAYSDSELDEPRVVSFVGAFQELIPLSIGELWALPTMLRLVLMENLRRLAEGMMWGWAERKRAESWAERVLASAPAQTIGSDHDDKEREIETPDFGVLSDPFVVRLMQLLRDQERTSLALGKLEDELDRLGLDANEVLQREQHRQASNQVTVGNCVLSLRLLSAVDWNTFFEQSSRVESILREDPSGIYAQQDFATSDRYRRVVEMISRGSKSDEIQVARHAIDLALSGRAMGSPHDHVGYYLLDRGRDKLTTLCAYYPGWQERLSDWVVGHPSLVYFSSIGVLLSLLLVGFTAMGLVSTGASVAMAVLVVLALLLPVSELAVGLVNHLLTLSLMPRVLPKLYFQEGIPAEYSTVIVIPSMLTRRSGVATLVERLETHYLANPNQNLRFALLTDFADAPTETMPQDEELLLEATERIKGLNDQYASGKEPLFFLFHRRRLWNASEGCWMGWERKRGKLSEFNRLIRGATDTSYVDGSAAVGVLRDVRYVITLDADTQMPRDAAGRLVGAMAHPLNRPHFDRERGRVVRGYGVLQPRVSFHLLAATRSRFAALLATSGGIDPYSTATSDTYMDLFGIGSFTGKGIYDVDAFEAATGETFPENRILSHDLIEGNYARCGLLSDTEVFDDFPARYHAYARREHRWVRGDWQLLPWLGARVPAPGGTRINPLPMLERWKLFDNLRRSLVPPAQVLLLVLGWTILPGSPWFWTGVAIITLTLTIIQQFIGAVIGSIRNRSTSELKRLIEIGPSILGQLGLDIAFLAYRAILLLDAISRTIYRLFVRNARLLEWETAASTEQRLGAGLLHFLTVMWTGPALGIGIGILVILVHPAALLPALPFLVAWLISPAVAYLVSAPRVVSQAHLSDMDRFALRRVARKTWHFFEKFVGDEDHWLPPDNFQEIPDGRIAHRTSPTNQGLLLLSTLAAHDLGYISLLTLVDRLEKTFDTFDRLEKQWGHFYNWYETRTLQALPPRYISTVDSGNCLACLLTLAHGVREKMVTPVVGPAILHGLADTLRLAVESTGDAFARQWALLEAVPTDLLEWDRWMEQFEHELVELTGRLSLTGAGRSGGGRSAQREQVLSSRPGLAANGEVERVDWAALLVEEIRGWRNELANAAPWVLAVREVDLHIMGESVATVDRWSRIRGELIAPASLSDIVSRAGRLAGDLTSLVIRGESSRVALLALGVAIRDDRPSRLNRRLLALAERSATTAREMDFRPLYRPERHLFAIGFNVAQGRLDNACYDLLASESCLTSYLAVARGEAPRRHWFQLGRPYIRAAGRIGLVSWGGTMFEYLMPRLLLRSLPGTLLAEAARTAVSRQIEYGKSEGLPWGISESAYSAQYVDGDYQYQAFGVPGLGLKQGLELDRVIAPYATAMATMLAPVEALENFRRLAKEGAEGEYGFHEAIDYTVDRIPRGQRSVVVRSYMAHHQGMSLVALTNALFSDVMALRFQSEPTVRAIDLLLQERVPSDAPLVDVPSAVAAAAAMTSGGETVNGAGPDGAGAPMSRRLTTPATPVPRTHLLSNMTYHVMITNAGSGFSVCKGLDITRWREDSAREIWGQFCFVRDVQRGLVWSAGHQPICRHTDDYEVIFAADKATFRRRDAGIETQLEVIVSPEHQAEVRRLIITNQDTVARELDATSYAEIVLGPRRADLAHPAFGKLFIETEWLEGHGALLCRRRPRSASESPLWALHVLAVDRSATGSLIVGEVQYETDRSRFLGRGRTPANPAALEVGASLSGTTGAVLDPIVAIRRRFRIEPGGSAVMLFTTAFAESRSEALALADQYREVNTGTRAFELAWARIQVEHRHHDRSGEDARLFQRLGSHVLFAGSALRADESVLARNRLGQPALWRFGVSGDRAIVLAMIGSADEHRVARELVTAQNYLRQRGLEFDLVLMDDEAASYRDELNRQLLELVRASGGQDWIDRPGGVFVRRGSQMEAGERILLQAAARVVIVGERGPLATQLDRAERHITLPGRLAATEEPRLNEDEPMALPDDLLFTNGFGGFTNDGREYCILVTAPGFPKSGRNGPPPPPSPNPRLTPAPWVNVIANGEFGFLISEAGSGFTWAINSQANRLTPWNNDPVSDSPGEVVYLRDEETGEIWSPTPLPVAESTSVLVRHGQGYSTFERNTHGLAHELTLFVSPSDPVKLVWLRVRNTGDAPRRLSATFYLEWVLGLTRDDAAMHVVTEVDAESGALFARNAFRMDLGDRIAFADVNLRPRSFTTDRATFLGRHGALSSPGALGRVELAGITGTALDPCGAIQAPFRLEAGGTEEVVFILGEADSVEAARELLDRYRKVGQAEQTFADVKKFWDSRLGVVNVRTPSPAIDVLVNRWLLYQVMSCRLWGRSGFYQSGGAYGFRDQLQDVMALVHAAPDEARSHVLRAAGRQFVEGDVQHWWHPPSGRGIRTRISDDPFWLPFVTAHYVLTTGDFSILDEMVPFLDAPTLKPGQEDDYGLPGQASEVGSLYEHCLRAVSYASKRGVHGLPLMGHGDWNDGMNRVGAQGRGESVWLAWFVISSLGQFGKLMDVRGDTERLRALQETIEQLRLAVESSAWDGGWYRRAYFDDGTPLGSAQNDECKIDSLSQSWAILCGIADRPRTQKAMEAVERFLVDREGRLILLFAPPFDDGVLEPGYVKGYVPGVRENGGQYTHAAAWVIRANAVSGDGARAFGLLELINPVNHSADLEGAERYKVEPYVIAGDAYSRVPHVGRGGWTWYTGSASWVYRTIVESMLGLEREGERIEIKPNLPPDWSGYDIGYRFGSAQYQIHVEVVNQTGKEGTSVWIDGQAQPETAIRLRDDGQNHDVRVTITRL